MSGDALYYKRRGDRIRLIIVAYSLSGGGAERFTSTLLCGLDQSRFKTHLVLLRDEIAYPVPETIDITVLGKYKPWDWPRTVLRLRALIEQTQADVVLSNIAYTSRLTALALIGRRERPVILVRTGSDPNRGQNGINYLLNNHAAARAELIIANSKGLAEAFASKYRIPAHRVQYLYTPTDINEIELLARQRLSVDTGQKYNIVLSVGRLIPEKDPEFLLTAFARTRAAQRSELWFCGTGPLETNLRTKAAILGIGHRVRFLGFQKNPYAVMAAATAFVLSSRHEGLPNALIEAQALGLPAVSTRCPYGPEEIIEDGITGLLVDVGDVNAMTSAIDRLIDDKLLREQMTSAARRHIRARFNAPECIRAWESVIISQMAHKYGSSKDTRRRV